MVSVDVELQDDQVAEKGEEQVVTAPAKKTKKAKTGGVPVKQKTVLVTGAGGALATKVVESLRKNNNIVAVDFRYKPRFDKGVHCYRVSYNKRSFEDIFRVHKIDAVIHLGRMGLYESDHYHRYNVNVLGTQKLLDLCRKYEVKQVLVLSTYYVYGASPYNPALITEDYPLKVSALTMDLVDSVELENLASIHMWKHQELNITILRPCNIAGPGVLNSLSVLLAKKYVPVLTGFSPMMQFIHVNDMAMAIDLAYEQNKPGIYNVAANDWVAYTEVLKQCGCKSIPIPSLPRKLPVKLTKLLNWKAFPSYLVNYYKYSVIIDGSLFANTFGFKPMHTLSDVFDSYRSRKDIRVF